MKAFIGILWALMSLAVAVASQQYYDDYGDDNAAAGGDYYQQQDYGGDYGDYYAEDGGDGAGGDTLYSDYAKHQEEKAMGVKGGLNPMLKNAAYGAAGWFVGAKFHSRRAVKKATVLAGKQQQKLYERYVKDVSALQLQNAQLQEYIQQTTIQQLTEEFLQADTNNDRKVSRLEFERYKADYLKKHPEADPSMFPRFEDFDPDHNGMVTLQEHEDYYRQQGMIA
ncbi:unnamed protein product [Pseudo-nitzschia multistriata]|uniref:Uncharacterized protein n=1 Tax=Pseudo-nitzschia multistriata TaxID=183589 RepID=A0A448ZL16_9STRA|nr:unnamed protein product [Pseudo-nitzschia multistriata]